MMWVRRSPAWPAMVATSCQTRHGPPDGPAPTGRPRWPARPAPPPAPHGRPRRPGAPSFAVQRHVKHAGAELFAHLRLQLQALAHPCLDAAVVVAHGQEHARGLRPQHVTRMPASVLKQMGHAACSSCSSLSVLLMQAWLNSSIGRPSTTVYSPLAVVTGKPNMVSLGMPYQPSDGMPMVTTCRWCPAPSRACGRWRRWRPRPPTTEPRASMMAAPRLPTVGRKGVGVPFLVVDHVLDAGAADGGEAVVGVHGGRVVAPRRPASRCRHGLAGLGGNLAQGTVVVQAQHGGEVLARQVRRAFMAM